jgi:hypothetical protein
MISTLSVIINPAFRQSLLIMLEGMSGIFVFMIIFYGLIKLLNRIFKQANQE